MKSQQADRRLWYNGGMNRHLNILVAMPTASHSERMKLEGILQYAHGRKGRRWNLELDLGGIAGRLTRRNATRGFDGLIAYVRSDAERKSLLATAIPTVLIEDLLAPTSFPRRRDVVTLLCDHVAEGRTAADYFIRRLHRQFAFVGTRVNTEYSALRLKGYAEALAAAGFDAPLVPPAHGGLAQWLRRLPKPCALFAVHDLRARQVLAAAEEAGIAVPEELAVLGVDNDDVLCTTTSPTLSSIPTFDRPLGFAAGRALNELILERAPGRVIRTRHAQVVTRRSTDVSAVADIFVARALDWAGAHLDEKLTASELARHAGCSKLYLQTRAERVLGLTLAAAIRRLRLESAAGLLAGSDLPVSDIAACCGFACVSHFAALMRNTHGLTPLAFRRRSRS